ncbi:hypothetical protein DWB85_01550 [Seongchinamella sediminis]|uniref:Uncharacterized protein n=1 Tax=Seongchinamella sediminis TaxID=2283635 RepID=A0A3L7E2T0_9GAMM|nr:hypothetical protein [Seongchinamella sediminis]RLQ23864.1 hypothetical protein DWB85_01550 [Seongchinamella sediminis]
MSVKPRKNVFASSDQRIILHAGLFLICFTLSVVGVGAMAFLCFPPAAGLVELLSAISPTGISRRM